jgi:hypothetical protein
LNFEREGSKSGGIAHMDDCKEIFALGALFLVSSAVNLWHWRGRKDEHFFYYPGRGGLPSLSIVSALVLCALSLLALFGVVSANIFLVVTFGFGVVQEFYSIGYRQSRRDAGPRLSL